MELGEVLSKYNLSEATLKNWKKLNYIEALTDIKKEEIENIINDKIKSRRNKKKSSDNIIPSSYVKDKNIIKTIEKIVKLKNKYSISTNQILHEIILKILNNYNLTIPNDVELVLGMQTNNKEFKQKFKEINIEYEKNNDFLGCLYMSLISIGQKDTNGIFYTPFDVVDMIIDSTNFDLNKKILDPSCGSGNFLIKAFTKMKNSNIETQIILKNLYGYDIDKIAVLLSKINIYILDKEIQFEQINVYQKDFLMDDISNEFNYIIGNPPWGKKYTIEERKKLKKKYNINFSKMDSFAQFIIKSFDIMNQNGVLGFVLPSSILNIATHEDIRKFLLNNKIEYIKNIGKEFEEIVTDVIIIKVVKNSGKNNYCLYNNSEVEQNIFRTNPYCNFLISNPISLSIIEKIKTYPSFHLVDDVEYALGIVTGNNKKYLSKQKTDSVEPIISGKNIDRYHIDYSKIENFINFDKNNFQQVAQEKLYRWKNKIIYKFIGKKLCFAIENTGALTLNSANVICLSDDYNLDYIIAILNSRITQLFFEEMYSTHKVLKNHIQSFYIPKFSQNTVNKISEIIKTIPPQSIYSDDAEEIIYKELNLTIDEIKYLKSRFK